MTMLDILGRVIATVLLVAGILSLWLDCCAREERRRGRK